jgi:hypothetical protein
MLKKLGHLFVLMLSVSSLYSQCTSSSGTPVINETFGSGVAAFGPPLPAGVTNMTYVQNTCPSDGQYTIVGYTSGCFTQVWHTVKDHTGNPKGYFMLINASLAPSDFYVQTVNGLCEGTTYYFSSWIINDSHFAGGPTEYYLHY